MTKIIIGIINLVLFFTSLELAIYFFPRNLLALLLFALAYGVTVALLARKMFKKRADSYSYLIKQHLVFSLLFLISYLGIVVNSGGSSSVTLPSWGFLLSLVLSLAFWVLRKETLAKDK